jgi:hypothetical protein
VEEFTFLWGEYAGVPSNRLTIVLPDVLSEPDDSYLTREPKQTRKTKNTDTSGGIGAFFSKPPVQTVDSEDIMMNEGETGEELDA